MQVAAANAELPSPQALPEADVVIYDGHCRFCTVQVRRLAKLDQRKRLAFLSLHDPEVARLYPDLSYEALMRDMYVVDRRGRRHAGAAAFRYLSRRIPLLWPLAPLMHIPGTLPIWQSLYRMVARRRYRFGRTDACDDGSCKIHFS